MKVVLNHIAYCLYPDYRFSQAKVCDNFLKDFLRNEGKTEPIVNLESTYRNQRNPCSLFTVDGWVLDREVFFIGIMEEVKGKSER